VSGEPPRVAILAAGAGARMKGVPAPKAAAPLFFRPMIQYALAAVAGIPARSVTIVAGAGEKELREAARPWPETGFVRQDSPAGTADAARALEADWSGPDGEALLIYADAPLLTAESLSGLLAARAASGKPCAAGRARPGAEPAAWCFEVKALFDALRAVKPAPDGELRLEDAFAALAARGGVFDHLFADPLEGFVVGDPYDLWRAEDALRERFNRGLMLSGVTLTDPRTTVIDPRCRVEPGARVEGGCTVVNSIVEAGAVLESHCRVVDSEVGRGTLLRQGTSLEKSGVGRDCRLGPYARLRDGARLDDGVWVGNYVEIKNSTIGAGTRAAHLSFIGDATVGRDVNIGCGFITCNSSGRPLKQRTVIEDGVFIGSASQAIAPVTLGAGSFIATGTSVTEDAPPGSFVISRGRQVTKPGYAKKYAKPRGAAPSR
jgi:bifunctional UDP-N-acetylglucosamine pyrophosphorylase/glucosamine-1-phosphate N-acetyltransferase